MDTEFTAAQAHANSKEKGSGYFAAANNINYTLTLKRVLDIVKSYSEQGETFVTYNIPYIVLDGTTTNQELLARQIKKRLVELGYIVIRRKYSLYINWDLDLERKEIELEKENRRKQAEAEEAQRRRVRELKRVSKFGARQAVPIASQISPANGGGNSSVTTASSSGSRRPGFSVLRRRRPSERK